MPSDHFELKILCDGYVTGSAFLKLKHLILNTFLCDGHVIEASLALSLVTNMPV
jgi:hypothetical protein